MNRVFKILLSILVFSMVFFSPVGQRTVNAASVNYDVTGGQLIFDTATGTLTGFTGNPSDVVIPNQINGVDVKSIGKRAFSFCTSLSSVNIPSSVTNISAWAFNGCSKLETINVDQNNPAYSSQLGVLFNKQKTELVRFPGGKAGIYSIPDGIVKVINDAFTGCIITSVTIPSSVTSINAGDVFYWCLELTDINVDLNNSTYSSQSGVLFDKAKMKLISFPGGRTGSYSIPDGVAIIGNDAFRGCISISDLNIPSSVTTIEANAFRECYSLTRVAIPSSVISIGNLAFSLCSDLSAAYFYGNAPSIDDTVFSDTKPGFTVYHLTEKTGFTNPWDGYPTATFVDSTTPNSLQSIAITTSASKLSYNIGDNLDISGLVVTGTYSDGSTKIEPITAENITGFNSAVAATDQVLTITVKDNTVTYKVQIIDPLDTSGMIEITTPSPIVSSSKVWTIKLSGVVNESSLNGKIYVTNSKGKKQPITCSATLVDGLSQIEVKPDKDYSPDDYILWVKNITSTKGIGIKKQVFLRFTVQ